MRKEEEVWSAVQWWEEWQLRILVLGSLGIQWFLLLAAPMRKYTIPHFLRTFIWLAYISSDALAIYALATLFNRHAAGAGRRRHCASGSVLEVLWAPVLLIHLGGQREMSAYTIEDNELWRRQTVTLVSQVTVAIYAFYKSWPADGGDRRLLLSAVLLFVIGVLSFTEKPWALRRASINRLAAVSSTVQAGKPVSKWRYCFTQLDLGTDKSAQRIVMTDRDKVLLILSDMSLLAADSDLKQEQRRRRQRRSLVGEEHESTEEVDGDLLTLSPRAEMGSKRWLRRAFGLIYTRANVVLTPAYLAYHLLLVPFLHVTAIALFATSGKRHYSAVDVKTTYVLLCLTAALDILAESIRQLLFKLMSMAGISALCETVPQYDNLIRSALRRTQPAGALLKCAANVGYTEGFFVCRRRNLYRMLAGLIFSDLVGANARGLDFTSYRSFSPGRRNWVLNDALRAACGREVRDSLRGSFDRGVILWHIATDLCCIRRTDDVDAIDEKFLECTEAISDYMAHLLNLRPDMLMTGSRQHLFTQAMEEVELILKDIESQQQQSLKKLTPRVLAEKIMEKAARAEPAPPRYPLVHDACRLAEEVMGMEVKTRCQVMYRVWVGMLFYSASMCRGYLHAKSLGEGGEFLSVVWLILSLKGAKTLADKLQMPEPETEPKPGPCFPGQGERTAAVATADEDGEDLSFLLLPRRS
ncbi:uncharacterized protein LOC102707997 [Oryza brachyantha]|uniref:uncharacterized protein LOC102707997 n=1 Tax=Oryza brachyantha TaxID=4533 RepID=UPI001AD9D45D|nr:uncharacterized protein LOC102707997 [Oryza brachyantha]